MMLSNYNAFLAPGLSFDVKSFRHFYTVRWTLHATLNSSAFKLNIPIIVLSLIFKLKIPFR